MSLASEPLETDELAPLRETIRRLERENALMRRALEGISACHRCDICQESATLTLDLVRTPPT
jgi:hypothetical protein